MYVYCFFFVFLHNTYHNTLNRRTKREREQAKKNTQLNGLPKNIHRQIYVCLIRQRGSDRKKNPISRFNCGKVLNKVANELTLFDKCRCVCVCCRSFQAKNIFEFQNKESLICHNNRLANDHTQ